MKLELDLPTDLHALRTDFKNAGFELWIVGGDVRARLAGEKGKDVDLATDANTEQMKKVGYFSRHVRRVVSTGEKHGTLTFLLESGAYEVTMLRVETGHDGRHAQVEHTSNLLDDLARRDLTINAMALTFEGDLIDPYEGQADLCNGVVRFVGDAHKRIAEDYLRILRWVRFLGRYGRLDQPLDHDTERAVIAGAPGLRTISRERVWSEFRQIISGPNALMMLFHIDKLGLTRHLDLPEKTNPILLRRAIYNGVTDPVSLTVAYLGRDPEAVARLAQAWKWSRAEADKALFLTQYDDASNVSLQHLLAYEEYPRDWVVDFARIWRMSEKLADWLETWEIPVFPVKGRDLIEAGMGQSQALGRRLTALKALWANDGYKATKEELLALDWQN